MYVKSITNFFLMILIFIVCVDYVGDDGNMQIRIIAGAIVAVVVLLMIIIIMTVLFLRR